MDQTQRNTLVAQAIKGDKKAFEELCREQGQHILYMCTKFMGNLHDGEDAAQEVFIRMHQNIGLLKTPEAFVVWQQKLLYSTCMNLRKKRMKNAGDMPIEDFEAALSAEKLEDLPQAYVEDRDKRQKLLDVIGGLPYGMRTCVLLFYFEDMSYEEIADVVGISSKTVSVQLHRARLKIKMALEKEDESSFKGAPLLPMAALSAVFQYEAADIITGSMVANWLKAGSAAAGIRQFRRPSPKQVAQVLSGIAGAAAAVAVSVYAVVQFSSPGFQGTVTSADPSPQSNAAVQQAPASEAESAPEVASSQPPASSEPASSSRSAPRSRPASSSTATAGGSPAPAPAPVLETMGGWVYLSSPEAADVWNYALQGASVELIDAATGHIVNQYNITAENSRFDIASISSGTYKVRIVLPTAARFSSTALATAEPAASLLSGLSLHVEEASPWVGWVTLGGSPLLDASTAFASLHNLSISTYYPSTITGQINLSGGSFSLEGQILELVSPGGTAISTAVLAANGSFVFENPPVVTPGSYTLRFASALPDSWGLSQPIPVLILAPGESYVLQNTDIVLSEFGFTFRFASAACGCGHQNPHGILISNVYGGSIESLGWQIVNTASGLPVASGSGAYPGEEDNIDLAIEELYTLGDGNYVLVVTAVNEYGTVASRSSSGFTYGGADIEIRPFSAVVIGP
ncbi:MAG: sigma-70 family RNA polymerase sigma factor [Oscillospiraceae bacterium]